MKELAESIKRNLEQIIVHSSASNLVEHVEDNRVAFLELHFEIRLTRSGQFDIKLSGVGLETR